MNLGGWDKDDIVRGRREVRGDIGVLGEGELFWNIGYLLVGFFLIIGVS